MITVAVAGLNAAGFSDNVADAFARPGSKLPSRRAADIVPHKSLLS